MARILEIFDRKRRTFWRARKGNVAMMFGLALVPVMIAAGAGLDMARGMMARSAMSEALDAAALAVGSTPNVTQDQAQQIAQKYFNQNYHGDSSYGSDPVLGTPQIVGQSVTLSASQQVNTTLLAVGGFPHLNITAASTVVWGQTKLWVALALDNTGSMSDEDNTHTSKISALKTAVAGSGQLLDILKAASSNVGDVQATIVPFSKDVNVGTGAVNADWLEWTDWESQPANTTIDQSVGMGSACPFTDGANHRMSPYGFYCTNGAANGSSTVSTIPSSGLICPGIDNGAYNSGRLNRYYNGCYTSVPTQTATTTKVRTTPTTVTYACTQVNTNNPTCNQTNSNTGSNNTVTNTVVTSGYTPGNDGSTVTNTNSSNTNDGTKSCNTSHGTTTCTWTRTTVNNAIRTTVTIAPAAPFTHQWVVNDHSTWSGCVMDRKQNYDTTADSPSAAFGSKFPTENSASCVGSVITALPQTWTSDQWDDLKDQVNAMVANGSTNQTIGLAHAMQSLTNTTPYNAPELPDNTTRYIILLSDGLNTQNRWSGDGSNQSVSVDNRMAAACTNAKAAGYIIYTVYVNLGGQQGNSTVLQNCASDSAKFYSLTTSGQIVTAFNQIGQQITALRVSR